MNLGKIRNNKEPRPFSAYPVLVPYVHSNKYSNTEVEDGVDLLEKANLLKAITLSTNKKEKRYRIANKELISLTQQLRIIGTIYFRKIILKIGFVDKATEKEKAIISHFHGEKRGGHVIAYLNDQRKKILKEYAASKLKKIKQFLKKLCSWLQKLLEDCRKQNESITNDEFLKKLCLPFELSIDKT